jgi:hypothetical protein
MLDATAGWILLYNFCYCIENKIRVYNCQLYRRAATFQLNDISSVNEAGSGCDIFHCAVTALSGPQKRQRRNKAVSSKRLISFVRFSKVRPKCLLVKILNIYRISHIFGTHLLPEVLRCNRCTGTQLGQDALVVHRGTCKLTSSIIFYTGCDQYM